MATHFRNLLEQKGICLEDLRSPASQGTFLAAEGAQQEQMQEALLAQEAQSAERERPQVRTVIQGKPLQTSPLKPSPPSVKELDPDGSISSVPSAWISWTGPHTYLMILLIYVAYLAGRFAGGGSVEQSVFITCMQGIPVINIGVDYIVAVTEWVGAQHIVRIKYPYMQQQLNNLLVICQELGVISSLAGGWHILKGVLLKGVRIVS